MPGYRPPVSSPPLSADVDAVWHEIGKTFGCVEEMADTPEAERSEAYTCIDNTYLPDSPDFIPPYFDEAPEYRSYSPQNAYFDEMVQVVDTFEDAERSWVWREKSHMVKFTGYATGDVELIAVERLGDYDRSQPRKPRAQESREEMTAASIASSAARSKRTFTRKVMQIQADTMLTGTIRGAIKDRDEFDKIVGKFTKKFQRIFPDIKYAMCAELHKSGGWHWHMATRFSGKYIPFKRLHAIWRSAITGLPESHVYEKSDTPGNVDVSYSNKRGKRRQGWQSSHLARYIGKYLVKDIENMADKRANKKRYWSTKGISKPVVVRFFVTIPDHKLPLLAEQIISRLGRKDVKRSLPIHSAAMVGYYSSTF